MKGEKEGRLYVCVCVYAAAARRRDLEHAGSPSSLPPALPPSLPSARRSIMQRDVRYPDGREVSFDIMDQPGSSVLVFAWNSSSHTTTLIEEYAPGSLQVRGLHFIPFPFLDLVFPLHFFCFPYQADYHEIYISSTPTPSSLLHSR